MHVAFVTTTQHGHLNPAIPTMQALRAKGCKVTCLLLVADGGTLNDQRRAALGPVDVRVIGEVHIGPWSGPPEAIRQLLETTQVAEETAAAIRALAPDFVLVDSFPLTTPAVVGAHKAGVPYALTSANLGPITPRRFRETRWAYDEITRDYLLRHGVRWSEDSHSPRAPVLSLAPAIRALVGEEAVLDGVTLVGLPGAEAVRGDESSFSQWERLDPSRPLVYVSFGTIFYRRPELLRQILAATSGLGVQVVASVNDLGDELAGMGDHIVLAPYVPQREMLQRASVFVTHGGYNSVAESVRAGKPMLVIPLAIDQPVQAHYVARAGFGRSLRPQDATPPAISAALEALLDPRQGYEARVQAVAGACGDSARTTADLVVAAIQGS
ncbi:MAG: glycosyltransferase family 1 protein [Myxococcales bacterium]|nr:glycosyltransferase family 1 protein [Myxococcales bacterium]